MTKLRLIESFTWMMLNIEWYILEGLDEKYSKNILRFKYFEEVREYLKDVSEQEGLKTIDYHEIFNTMDYFEILDYLINLDKSEQLKINEKLLTSYSEGHLLKLIQDTIEMLNYIELSK